MIKKITLLLGLFITVQFAFSQSELDQYKYVIVPTSYEFSKEPDQYRLNSLTKFLFEKQGFIVLMSNEAIPQDLINNGCLALRANVNKVSGLLKTKLQIQLLNCYQEVVLLSKIGESRDKNYMVAYNLALRDAFTSFDRLYYSYTTDSDLKIIEVEPIASTVVDVSDTISAQTITETKETNLAHALTARKKDGNNYELLNDKGDVVYTLIFSGKEAFYMVEGMQATVYKRAGNWVIAKTVSDGSLQVETLNVSF